MRNPNERVNPVDGSTRAYLKNNSGLSRNIVINYSRGQSPTFNRKLFVPEDRDNRDYREFLAFLSDTAQSIDDIPDET